MKIHIRKISENYIESKLEASSTSIDLGWMDKKEAQVLLDALDSAREYLAEFIGIEDSKEALIKALKALSLAVENLDSPEGGLGGLSELIEAADDADAALTAAGAA